MGRGLLTFKGDTAKKKKKKSKHAATTGAQSESRFGTGSHEVEAAASLRLSEPSNTRSDHHFSAKVAPPVENPQIKAGSGKITTSGTVVTGHGTCFESELSVGDAMIVVINGQQEMRVVKMRLSDTSCGLSSSFSSSLSSLTSYQVIRKPRNPQAEAEKRRTEMKKQKEEVETSAFGTYRGTNEFVYRERTNHGSYRIQKVSIDEQKSRSELLQMRSKKTSDKYC